MKIIEEDGKAYGECTVCSWGCSGEFFRVEDKADEHEYENTGHRVRINPVED